MVPLQTQLLAGLVVVLLVGGGAYRWGHTHGVNACQADRAEAAERAVDAAREESRARSVADGVFVAAGSAARAAEVTRRVALEADIARRPVAADCGLDAPGLRLLNDAIRGANGGSSAAGGLPDPVPTDTGIDRGEPAKPP